MFLIIGDKGRDQISNLHNFYSQINQGKKLNILWCYKNELGFSNHAKKKMKKIKKQMNKGVFELNDENAFDLFISTGGDVCSRFDQIPIQSFVESRSKDIIGIDERDVPAGADI